jgi:hypothetical protein
MVNEPRAWEPTDPPSVVALFNVHVSGIAPAPAVTAVVDVVEAAAAPAMFMLQAVGDALDDPVFCNDT